MNTLETSVKTFENQIITCINNSNLPGITIELVLKAALYQVQLQNLQIKCREEHEASETSKVSETTELQEDENDANPDSNS